MSGPFKMLLQKKYMFQTLVSEYGYQNPFNNKDTFTL